MICNKCGTENDTNSKFCKKCGQQLENMSETTESAVSNVPETVEEVVPSKTKTVEQEVQNTTENVQQEPQNPVEPQMSQSFEQQIKNENSSGKSKKSKRNIIIGAVVGGVALITLITVLICVLISNASTIKIDEYISIETDGYDGYGTAKATIDWKRIEKKYGDKIELTSKAKKQYGGFFSGVKPVDVLKELVEVKIDKKSDLSNGDKVKYTVKLDKDLKKYVKCKIKIKNGTKTVKKLEKVGKFDPFEDLTVTFEGISPNGEVEYKYDGEQLGYYDFSFSETYGLKNGDKIKVTINDDMEYYAEQYGEVPEKLEMEYEVKGLDEYVSSFSDISKEYFEELKEEAEETVNSYVEDNYDDTYSLADLEYSGYVFNGVKDVEDHYYDFNSLYLVYSGNVSDSEGKFETTKVYYPVRFTDILSKESGFSYDENEGIAGNSYLGDSWERTKGYVNPLTCYIEIEENSSDNYKTESGDDFEKYADYELVTELKGISEEGKKTLVNDAIKRIEEYVASDYNNGSVATDIKSAGEYLLVAKEQSTNFEYNNKYIVVCSATVSNTEGKFATTTVYFPVEYEGLAKYSEDEYMYTSVRGILGNSSFPDSWYFTKGYVSGTDMYTNVITERLRNYKCEVSDSLKEFGE